MSSMHICEPALFPLLINIGCLKQDIEIISLDYNQYYYT